MGPIGYCVDHHRHRPHRLVGQEKVFRYLAGNVIGQAVNEEPFCHVRLDSRPDSGAAVVYPTIPLVAMRTLSM